MSFRLSKAGDNIYLDLWKNIFLDVCLSSKFKNCKWTKLNAFEKSFGLFWYNLYILWKIKLHATEVILVCWFGKCQSIKKSGQQTFRRRFVSGSLFVSPCLSESFLKFTNRRENRAWSQVTYLLIRKERKKAYPNIIRDPPQTRHPDKSTEKAPNFVIWKIEFKIYLVKKLKCLCLNIYVIISRIQTRLFLIPAVRRPLRYNLTTAHDAATKFTQNNINVLIISKN